MRARRAAFQPALGALAGGKARCWGLGLGFKGFRI